MRKVRRSNKMRQLSLISPFCTILFAYDKKTVFNFFWYIVPRSLEIIDHCRFCSCTNHSKLIKKNTDLKTWKIPLFFRKMFPLFFRSVSGIFPAFFLNDSGIRPENTGNRPEKKRKHFPEKPRNLWYDNFLPWTLIENPQSFFF